MGKKIQNKTARVVFMMNQEDLKKNPNEMLAFWKFKILDECQKIKDNNKKLEQSE
jgi:hypothetical protein